MSVTFKKLVASLMTISAAALLAVGCGSSDNGGSGGSGELSSDQTLKVNMGKELDAGKFVPATMAYLDALNVKGFTEYAGLYRLDGENSDIVNDLATGAPEVSKDGLEYTIKMRTDAMWSDGKPITAEDVITSVKYAFDPKSQSYFQTFLGNMKGVCEFNAKGDAAKLKECPEPHTDGKIDSLGMEAVDDHTLKITLVKPVPWFTQLLTSQLFYPVRQDQLDKFGVKTGSTPDSVASGPFKLSEYKPGTSITFVKNDKYYNADNVKLKKIVFRMVEDSTTASQLFKQEKLDTGVHNTMFPSTQIDKWKADDRFITSPTVAIQYAYLNTSSKELSDPKVRQALALAIDRKAITERVLKNGSTPAYTVVPTEVPGSDVWAEGAQEFLSKDGNPDVEKAKSLLDEAGFDKSKTLQIYFNSESTNAPRVAELIQQNLDELGVKVNLNPTPGDTMSTVGYGYSPVKPNVHIVLQGWIQDYLDAQDWYQLFYGPNVAAGLNSSNFEDADFDKAYKEALDTVDDSARFELYKQLEADLTGPDGKMPAIPLFNESDTTLAQPWVKGMRLLPSGFIWWDKISIEKH